jgi:hypothetical protein
MQPFSHPWFVPYISGRELTPGNGPIVLEKVHLGTLSHSFFFFSYRYDVMAMAKNYNEHALSNQEKIWIGTDH